MARRTVEAWWASASLECSWAAGSWAQEMAHWRGQPTERWLEPLTAIPRVILKGFRSVRSRGWERGQARGSQMASVWVRGWVPSSERASAMSMGSARVLGWARRWAGSLAAARA